MDRSLSLTRLRELIANGEWRQARDLALSALSSHPDSADDWFCLGVSLHALGDTAGAAEAFRRAGELAPDPGPALNAHATVLAEQGKPAAALAILDRAIALFPLRPDVWFNRGVVMEQLGRNAEALGAYEKSLELDASFVPARLNRGGLLMTMRRYQDAVTNNRTLVSLVPESADASFNLAEALLGLGQSLEALDACERALALDPRHAKAHIDRGLALSDLGRFSEASVAFETAEKFSPGAIREFLNSIAPADPSIDRAFDPRLVFLYRGYDRLMHCDWSMRKGYIRHFIELAREAATGETRHIGLPLAYQVLALPVAPELAFGIAGIIGSRYASAVAETCVRFEFSRKEKRIRLGYLSPDFREHLNAYLTCPLFRERDGSRFEVYVYSIGPSDNSAIGQTIKASADHFVDLSAVSDLDAARRINSDGIDILVDLGGYTEHCRPGIAAFRPAPVQLSYLGFPGTMGAPWIDYRISDRIATPAGQEQYWTERLVLLPDTFFIYDRFESPSAVSLDRTEYGIPENAFVFCCFNNYYKIEPEIFSTWMEILKAVPQSVLWLAGRDDVAATNLRQEAAIRGVSAERLLFAPFEPRARYRARFGLADLFLDTPIFNAMTTACDALAAGLPVLTVAGSAFQARVAASLLTAADFPEGITQSMDEYRDRAIDWGSAPEKLLAIRRRRMSDPLSSRLFDTRGRVRQIEAAYIEMWRRHEQGLSPATFDVPALPAAEWRNNWH